jgi:hypothetical protein
MKSDVILFFVFFGTASSACAISSHILLAMVGEVNRKRDDNSQISYFGFSWPTVWREYRILYPNGRYATALVISVILGLALSLITIYYLFGVLPKYALPSR